MLTILNYQSQLLKTFQSMPRIFIVQHSIQLGKSIKILKQEGVLQKLGNKLLINLPGLPLRKNISRKMVIATTPRAAIATKATRTGQSASPLDRDRG